MTEYAKRNALIQRDYLHYLEQACGRARSSIDQEVCSIGHFDDFFDGDFAAFTQIDAIQFKSYLCDFVSEKTGEELSASMISKILANVAKFFSWLATRKEFEPRFTVSDVEYLNPTAEMRATMKRQPIVSVPDMSELVSAVLSMPSGSIFEQRNRAAMALLLLCGARANAHASLRIRSVNCLRRLVDQDGILVRTKKRKRIVTWFFPVGDAMLTIVADWMKTLATMGYLGDDPLFPADERAVGPDGCLMSIGLAKTVWETESPVRKIFQKMCADAGIPCRHPHAVRRSLVKLAFRSRYTLEELKAWSQNLGHNNIETTVLVYGEIPDWRQEEIMRDMWKGGIVKSVAAPAIAMPHLEPMIAMLHGYGYTVTPPAAA